MTPYYDEHGLAAPLTELTANNVSLYKLVVLAKLYFKCIVAGYYNAIIVVKTNSCVRLGQDIYEVKG